jgi:hypothetical protein
MKDALPIRVSALQDKLDRLQGLKANAIEARDFSALKLDLEAPTQVFANLLKQKAMLTNQQVIVNLPSSLAQVRKRASTLREKFRAEKKSTTLKRGTGWSSLLTEEAGAIKEVEAALLKSWKDFRSTAYAGDPPTVISNRIARTPENVQAERQYKETYTQFALLFQTLPSDASTVSKARTLAANLVSIAAQFNFAVSGDVKRFLDAVQNGGAPLILLTDEVKKWLAENDATDGYSIRASSRL